MATFEQFLPEVMPEVPGVPQIIAVNAVRNAVFDFCRNSLRWNELNSSIAVVAGVAEYNLVVPTGRQVMSVLSLNLSEQQIIYPASIEDVAAADPLWSTRQSSVINNFVQPTLGKVVLTPVPDFNGYMIPLVAYAPARDASTCDDVIYNVYLETIKYGALWKLKAMAGQPWSDPAGATYYEQQFWGGVSDATVDRQKGGTRAVQRVAPRAF